LAGSVWILGGQVPEEVVATGTGGTEATGTESGGAGEVAVAAGWADPGAGAAFCTVEQPAERAIAMIRTMIRNGVFCDIVIWRLLFLKNYIIIPI